MVLCSYISWKGSDRVRPAIALYGSWVRCMAGLVSAQVDLTGSFWVLLTVGPFEGWLNVCSWISLDLLGFYWRSNLLRGNGCCMGNEAGGNPYP
jgi:hypothetical protein